MELSNGEYYHVYNRGVEQRQIVLDSGDADRFAQTLTVFNTTEPTEGLHVMLYEPARKRADVGKKLVDIIAFCLNPNHFHLVLRQKVKGGISQFMQRIAGGYSRYFNNKYKRSGTLFQGPFKAKHIVSNDYLLHVCSYVNLNDKVHGLKPPLSTLKRSSWSEYLGKTSQSICEKKIILEQFKGAGYGKYANDALKGMLEMRPQYKELKEILLDL